MRRATSDCVDAIAYLIDESGIITHDVAVGVDAILALTRNANAKESFPDAAEAVQP